METYDLIIIGGGPAGLTAAIYAARYRLRTLVFSKEAGGLAATAHKICNFPSHKEINGLELMKRMTQQVEGLGVKIKYEEVKKIEKNDSFKVYTSSSGYEAKKIIFSVGTQRKKLGIKGEKEFLGKGVSYCATCDAGFFKDKTVAVIGGSNSALTAALLLSEYASRVYIVYRRNKFLKAEPAWVHLVEKDKKIKVLFNEEIKEIKGKDKVNGVVLNSGKKLKLEGLFIEIGSVPSLSFLEPLKVKKEKDYIVTDKNQKTNVHGFFAAGDITNNTFKQIIIASAEGAVAAYNVYEEIQEEK